MFIIALLLLSTQPQKCQTIFSEITTVSRLNDMSKVKNIYD